MTENMHIALKILLSSVLFAALPMAAKDIGHLKVGVIFPLSGSLAAYGSDAVAGMKIAAAQELSGDRAVRTEVDLLIRDSGSSAKVAADLAESLIKEHHVHALIGSLTSAATLAIAKVAHQHQRLHIVPISTASAITRIGPYIFRSCVTNGYQGRALAKFALDNLQKAACRYPARGRLHAHGDYCCPVSALFSKSWWHSYGTVDLQHQKQARPCYKNWRHNHPK